MGRTGPVPAAWATAGPFLNTFNSRPACSSSERTGAPPSVQPARSKYKCTSEAAG